MRRLEAWITDHAGNIGPQHASITVDSIYAVPQTHKRYKDNLDNLSAKIEGSMYYENLKLIKS